MILVWAPEWAPPAKNEQITKYCVGINVTDERRAMLVNLGSILFFATCFHFGAIINQKYGRDASDYISRDCHLATTLRLRQDMQLI